MQETITAEVPNDTNATTHNLKNFNQKKKQDSIWLNYTQISRQFNKERSQTHNSMVQREEVPVISFLLFPLHILTVLSVR